VFVRFTNNTYGASGQCWNSVVVSIWKPNGTVLNPPSGGGGTCVGYGGSNTWDTAALPSDGTYTIVVDPAGGNTGSLTVTVWDVPADSIQAVYPAPLFFGSTTMNVHTDAIGQNAALTFNKSDTSAGRIFVVFSNNTYGAPGQCWSSAVVTIWKPGGALLNPPSGAGTCLGYGGGNTWDTTALPVDGTYTIVIDLAGMNTGSVSVTIYDVPPDLIHTITSPQATNTLSVQTNAVGQNAQIKFNAITGQQVYVQFTNNTYGAAGQCWSSAVVTILKPNGAALNQPGGGGAMCLGYGGGNTWNWTTLPMDGTYTIIIDPAGTNTGSLTAIVKLTPGGAVRIRGLANVGEWLEASLDWLQPPGTLPVYQWQRCDSAGSACTNIPNEVGASHLVDATELGRTVRVIVTVSNEFGSTTLTSLPVSILDTIQTVAVLFRPYLYFDVGEHWRPLNVPNFLSEIFLDGTVHRLCYNAAGDCIPSPHETDFAPPYTKLDINGNNGNASSFYSPNPVCYKQVGGQDCDKGPDSAIYYEPTRDPVLGWLYLDYWFFYRYNDSPLPSGDHEGDWEGMTVVVDPTGPPNNTGGPVAAYELYAEHDGSTWSAYLGAPGTTHSQGYVGRGTHATYPIRCSPELGDLCGDTEWSYDGVYGWGRNDDQECGSACVIRFTAGWVTWGGLWGINDEGAIQGGGSPASPAGQGRFQCAQGGYGPGCPTPPFAGVPAYRAADTKRSAPPVSGPAGAASVCAAWEGRASAVAVCQPTILRETIRRGEISIRVKPNLRIPGFRGRIYAAKGITQAIGQPLRTAQQAVIKGPLQAGSEIVVRVADRHRRWLARFKLPRLARRSTATLTIDAGTGRPALTIRMAKRKLVPQYFAAER
jgi:hypothetical protein